MAPKKKKEDASLNQSRFLKKIAFFQDFDDNELNQLLSVSRWLKVVPGTLIIKEDASEKVLYILVKGTVAVFMTINNEGETKELTRLHTGATFGEMAFVSEAKRTAGVEAVDECYLLRVEPDILGSASVFLQLKFYQRFCEILVARLIATNKKVVDSPSKKEKPAPKPSSAKPSSKPEIQPKQISPMENKCLKNKVDVSALPPIPEEKSISRTKIKRRIQENINIIINPTLTAQLSSFVRGESTDTKEFSNLLSLDPALAAKVIQVANSSFFRRTTSVNSIPHALITVGVDHIKQVIEDEVLKTVGEKQLFGGFFSLTASYWQHAVVVGRIAELLKDTISLKVSEDVYLAGLLHDIGKLSLDLEEPDFYPQLLRPGFPETDISMAEKKYVGTDHSQAGLFLGEKMGIPQPYLDVILMHHTPEKARENNTLVALVHLANLFAAERDAAMPSHTERPDINNSFAWVHIQEHHRPFLDVKIEDFVFSFNAELNRSWESITDGVPSC
jgi:putative nucleotidyltransferase with HDIG domain